MTDPNNTFQYKLRSILHHIGQTPNSGHYTTCSIRESLPHHYPAKATDDKWVRFDDKVGNTTSLDLVIHDQDNQETCYMALYERISTQSNETCVHTTPIHHTLEHNLITRGIGYPKTTSKRKIHNDYQSIPKKKFEANDLHPTLDMIILSDNSDQESNIRTKYVSKGDDCNHNYFKNIPLNNFEAYIKWIFEEGRKEVNTSVLALHDPNIWNDYVVESGHERLHTKDLQTIITPDEWVLDPIINFYLGKVLATRQNYLDTDDGSHHKWIFVSSHCVTNMFENYKESEHYSQAGPTYDMKMARKFIKTEHLINYKGMIIPHHHGCHWALIYVDIQTMTI